MDKGEIVLYQPNDTVAVEVRLEEETVWLTQEHMVLLFGRERSVITKHIRNVFAEGELTEASTCAFFAHVQNEGGRVVKREIAYYNLDVIISVGYRVKSKQGTQFRIWASKILKDYLLRGYAISQRFDRIERKIVEHDQKFDLLIKSSVHPIEGIFFNGQIFDAYVFASNLIKSARKSIVLIDNYADESVLVMLSDRKPKVTAHIYAQKFTEKLQLSISKHSRQYEAITVSEVKNVHDRFLIIDDTVYAIGASMKDLGKRLFAFFKMEIKATELLKNIS